MCEFCEKHTVSRLFGAPPGYVGYEEGGQLTEKVRRKPFSVVLFDEIEKAHPDIFNSLLQILEDGRLTDGQGRVGRLQEHRHHHDHQPRHPRHRQGRRPRLRRRPTTRRAGYERMKDKVNDELKQHFRPEFLNRVDDIIVFHQLTAGRDRPDRRPDDRRGRTSGSTDKDMGIELTAGGQGRCWPSAGFDPVLGARPLRRTIQREIEDQLSREDPLRRAAARVRSSWSTSRARATTRSSPSARSPRPSCRTCRPVETAGTAE